MCPIGSSVDSCMSCTGDNYNKCLAYVRFITWLNSRSLCHALWQLDGCVTMCHQSMQPLPVYNLEDPSLWTFCKTVSDCVDCSVKLHPCISCFALACWNSLGLDEKRELRCFFNLVLPWKTSCLSYTQYSLQPFMDPVKFPNASNCSLQIRGWEKLLEMYNNGSLTFTSGGLGTLRMERIYLTWVCMSGLVPWPSSRYCVDVVLHIHIKLWRVNWAIEKQTLKPLYAGVGINSRCQLMTSSALPSWKLGILKLACLCPGVQKRAWDWTATLYLINVLVLRHIYRYMCVYVCIYIYILLAHRQRIPT